MCKILILDAVSLINIIERCTSKKLLTDLNQIGFEFHIVDEVEKEYWKKPTQTGRERFKKYKHDGELIVIDFDQEEVDVSILRKLNGLDEGELVSSLYLMQNQKYDLVSDDKAVHDILKSEFGIECKWTTNLLQELIYKKKITLQEAQLIYHEMKQNGFWGIKYPDFTE